MAKRRLIALLTATALIAGAGFAGATGAFLNSSIWGTNNPGQGTAHAAMPEAGQAHNHGQLGHNGNETHGDHDDNETGDDHDGNETGDDDQNETHGDHDSNETGDDNQNETHGDHDGNETGDDDQNETHGDHDDNETGDDENETDDAAASMIESMSVRQVDMYRSNNTDGNWSRNWTAGNISCTGSGNKTSGTISCSWPDFNFSFWGFNCSVSAGGFTKSWSGWNVTWNRTGGDITCQWVGFSWRHSDSTSGASADAATTRT